MTRHGMTSDIIHDMAWQGMESEGKERHGKARYDMAWKGMGGLG